MSLAWNIIYPYQIKIDKLITTISKISMARKNSQIVFKHDSNTIISVYSEWLKNKVGDFLYDPNLPINLIQKEKLASFNNIKVCEITYTSSSKSHVSSHAYTVV